MGDGFLSSRRERHVSIVALGAGIVAAMAGRLDLLVTVVAISLGVRAVQGPLAQLRREPWYAIAFALTGYAGVEIGPAIVDIVGAFS